MMAFAARFESLKIFPVACPSVVGLYGGKCRTIERVKEHTGHRDSERWPLDSLPTSHTDPAAKKSDDDLHASNILTFSVKIVESLDDITRAEVINIMLAVDSRLLGFVRTEEGPVA
jgi:hypothetical protein